MLMDETYDTISRINEKFNKMSKSHKKLATFVIDHYEQVAFMTAAKLAKTEHCTVDWRQIRVKFAV